VRRLSAAAPLVAALALPKPARAHGLGAVKDLPVPLWLFYYGAAIALLVSFVALGVLWRRPLLERAAGGRPLPTTLQRILLAPALRAAVGAGSLVLLGLVFAAALLGERSSSGNLAPTFVWVVFWLGLVPLVVLFGNVWAVLNPWRAAADAVAWAWTRLRRDWEPLLTYREALGRWPAALLLFLFTALELAYWDPADPLALALGILVYSLITWYGVLLFGREVWLANGEAFTVYFGLLARMAPFGAREGERGRELVLRTPFAGLARLNAPPGTLAFVAVMLGSVAFDGFSRTTWWQERRYSVQAPLIVESPGLAHLLGGVMNLAGLAAAVVVVALAYLGAVRIARGVGGGRAGLPAAFVGSLVPIALAYNVAHYFSLLVLQGQFAIPLASDPFGWGWDLVGTADFRPNLAVLSPNVTWYAQVGALVAGHVAGLTLAHDRAVGLFRSPPTALRTQYAMLALMVLYTVGGLWLLSRG
jgi:hypothetical protein